MKIENVFHRGVTCAATADSLDRCAELMTRRNVSALPVFDGDRLAGIITERDLVHAVASHLDTAKTPASACLTAGLATASPDDDSSDVAYQMLSFGVRHLPVLDHGRLVGMISARDLLEMEAWPPPRR